MSILRSLSVALILAVSPLEVAAQNTRCDLNCSEECAAAISGDDNASLTNPATFTAITEPGGFVDHYGLDEECEWLGETDCFDNLGSSDPSDLDGSLRRMANAIALADQIQFWDFAHTWQEETSDEGVDWIEPDADCAPFMTTWGTLLDCHIEVSMTSLMDTPVWTRSASFVHEVRHCHDVVGTGHVSCGTTECDERFEDEGAYQWAVAFLAQFATRAGPTWSLPQRVRALTQANTFLSTNFVHDPGFRFYLEPGVGAQHWTAPADGFQFLAADEAPASTIAITRLAISVEEQGTLVGVGPRIVGLHVSARHIQPDGTLAGPINVQLGSAPTDPNKTLVVDTSSAGPDRVITRLQLGWESSTASSLASPPSNARRLVARMRTRRIDLDGQLINPIDTTLGGSAGPCGAATCAVGQVCGSNDGVSPVCLDPTTVAARTLTLTAPAGELLSGVSLATGQFLASFQGSAQTALPVTYVELPALGVSAPTTLTECPVNTVATGVLAAEDSATEYPTFTGFFGLVCAPASLVATGAHVPASELTLVHPSYAVDGAVTPAGNVVGYDIAATWTSLADRGASLDVCPDGHAMVGLTGRSGPLVFGLQGLRCRPIGGGSVAELPMDIGGTGGLPVTVTCDDGAHVRGFRSARMGDSLRQLALWCPP